MRDSRNEFENAPDTGFFGKNCARICNLCEVYIFRFLIVGVLIVIIIIPIIIIINFVVSLTLAITAFAWIPIFLIFWYIFIIYFIGTYFQLLFMTSTLKIMTKQTYFLLHHGSQFLLILFNYYGVEYFRLSYVCS